MLFIPYFKYTFKILDVKIVRSEVRAPYVSHFEQIAFPKKSGQAVPRNDGKIPFLAIRQLFYVCADVILHHKINQF